MPVILITGPIASGKSVIGKALADSLNARGQTATFVDLDEEVLRIHGSFVWSSSDRRVADWLEAREAAAMKANTAIAHGGYTVLSGPFYVEDEIEGLTRYLDNTVRVFLYVLDAPLDLRLERNRRRPRVSPDEQLILQDKAVDALPVRYGDAVPNTGRQQDTVELLLQKIKRGEGQL